MSSGISERALLRGAAFALSSLALAGMGGCSSTSSPGSLGTGEAGVTLDGEARADAPAESSSEDEAGVTPDGGSTGDAAGDSASAGIDGGPVDEAGQGPLDARDMDRRTGPAGDAAGTNDTGTSDVRIDAADGTSLDAAPGIDAGSGSLPGDIGAAAGTPLVAAHSMTRALYSAYDGRLFQVRRVSDGKTQDIGVASAGGSVDMDTLNTFCKGTICTVSLLYDQTGNANDLPQATAANQLNVEYWSTSDGAQVPMAVTVNRQWLRNRANTKKIPIGSASQTEYFVVHGKYFNAKCYWDYGNMEAQVKSDGNGTMSALNIGTSDNGFASPGAGSGPWGMVDFESGVYAGGNRIGVVNPGNPSIIHHFRSRHRIVQDERDNIMGSEGWGREQASTHDCVERGSAERVQSAQAGRWLVARRGR
jgi:hypothetical protein